MRKELIIAHEANVYEEFDNHQIIRFDSSSDEIFVALHNVDVAILIHELCQMFGLTVGKVDEYSQEFHTLEELLEAGAFEPELSENG